MTQDLSPKEIQLLVEERALAIAKAAELPDVKAEEKLDPWFVIDRLRRNRVGDAALVVAQYRPESVPPGGHQHARNAGRAHRLRQCVRHAFR